MASPTGTTTHAAGNLLAATTIAASANVTFDVDYTTKLEGKIQFTVSFGTVAATAGLQVDAFYRIGAGPVTDTESLTSMLIPATASTSKVRTLPLSTGRYRIKLTNLDATNSITSVSATDDTVDGLL